MTIIAKKCISLLLSPVSFAFLNKKMDETMQRYNTPDSEYLVSMASHYSYWKQLMAKSIYGSPNRINFEGLLLSAPEQVHDYLSRIYGNYMELPPEDKRSAILEVFDRIEYASEEGEQK